MALCTTRPPDPRATQRRPSGSRVSPFSRVWSRRCPEHPQHSRPGLWSGRRRPHRAHPTPFSRPPARRRVSTFSRGWSHRYPARRRLRRARPGVRSRPPAGYLGCPSSRVWPGSRRPRLGLRRRACRCRRPCRAGCYRLSKRPLQLPGPAHLPPDPRTSSFASAPAWGTAAPQTPREVDASGAGYYFLGGEIRRPIHQTPAVCTM